MELCQECGKRVRGKEIIRVPERDGEYLICRTCWEAYEDMVDTMIDERILEKKGVA